MVRLVSNKDGSTRFFECDPDEGGCGGFTLTAEVKEPRVHLHCNACGFDTWRHTPCGLTNPSGTGSFVGAMVGMGQQGD